MPSRAYCIRTPPARLGVPKSFSYAQSRRSGKPPLCMAQATFSCHFVAIHLEGRCPVRTLGGGVVLVVTIPQSPLCGDSPLKVNWPQAKRGRPGPLHKGALVRT